MNTLSISPSPTTTSPACNNFRTGALSSNAASQGEVSPSDSNARVERDTRRLINAAIITAVAMVWFGLRHPVALAMIVCIGGSAVFLVGAICWNGHRGNAEIGVSDTQGRDGGAL